VQEPSLEGVWAKLDHADAHRELLNQKAERFLEKHPYRVISEEDPETSECLLRGQIVKQPPILEWGVLIGDFFHNLRSALDHLAWQLCLVHKPKREPPSRTEFPIFRDCSRFEAAARSRICGMSKAAQSVIRDLQPCYRRDNPKSDPLWYIHEMNNTDKHRLLHASSGAVAAVSMMEAVWEKRGISSRVLLPSPYTFEHDEVIARVPFIPHCAELAEELHFHFHVAFDKKGPGRGWPVDWGLKRWGRHVREEVVPKFEQFFPPKGS
jgi:hypothetical protein